jgi:hypothetical protein
MPAGTEASAKRPSARARGRQRIAASVCYRVWIVTCDGGQPCSWQELPPRAIAVEPAESGTMSRAAAARYVQAFNRAARQSGQRLWAVAVPVAVRYEGEPSPGDLLRDAMGPVACAGRKRPC